jgi:transcriptional regulator with XRE-family HTH domain
MTQERVGKLAHLDRTEIGKLENGLREPRLMTIVKLAAVLEVPPDALLLGIDWLVAESYQPLGIVLIDGRRVDQEPVSV